MPVTAGAKLDPEATRQKILIAAQELFYERGVHAVGVNEVAERSGASKLSIYRYFESKEGLIAAAVRARSDRVHHWLVRRTETVPPGRERVIAVFDLLLEWYGEVGYRGCAVMNAATDTRGGRPDVRALAAAHLARYRTFLADQLRAAGVGEPAALARRLLVLIEGATVISAVDGDPQAGGDARRAAEILLDAELG